MELCIGKKIAEFRHENNKTQEQLADYVGVSVAAVSKWETNQSYPDITLLPTIAEFFEVAIDALMEYKIADKGEKLAQIHKEISEPISNSDYKKALPIIFAALKKYPNDFTLLDSAGRMLATKAWGSETREQDFKDSISYREKAIKCAGEDKFKVFWLKKEIAFVYDSMGETDKALEKLNEINESNKFNLDIAHLKYKKGEKKEAKQIIQSYLWGMAFEFYMTTGKLANCYEDEGNLEMALESQKFHAQFLSSFINDTPNYADDICAVSYCDVAKYCKKLNKIEEMWENLERAVHHAVRFDKKPSYNMNVIKFMDGLGDGYKMSNSSSALACYGVLNIIKEQFSEFAADEIYAALCNELETAKKTKTEAGVWEK